MTVRWPGYRNCSTFCEKHDLKIASIAKLIEYRLQRESQISRLDSVHLPTDYGEFNLIGYESITSAEPHLALCKGDIGKLDETGKPTEHDRARAGAGTFGMHDRRSLPLAALRVRLSTCDRYENDRENRSGRSNLSTAGRSRHRLVKQTPRLQTSGARPRHR